MDSTDFADTTLQQDLAPTRQIPQFLLDAQHPWLVANRKTIELLPDPATFLHSAPGSSTHPDGATLTVPPDLFHHVRIGNHSRPDGSQVQRSGWSHALSLMRELSQCPATSLARVRTLRIDVWVEEESGDGPTDELVSLFADVLGALPALNILMWGMPGDPELMARFREAFEARGLRLPSVVELHPSPGWGEVLVGLCPNLRALEGFSGAGNTWSWSVASEPGIALVKAVGKVAPLALTRFAISATLSADFVKEIFKSTPHLTSLALDGDTPTPSPISYKRLKAGERYPAQDAVLKGMLLVLARFPRLRTLELPSPANLGFGLARKRQTCGSVLGQQQELTITRQYWWDIEGVASMVVEALPGLEVLRVDRREAIITRNGDGSGSTTAASWPRSGRVEEHLQDIMPDCKRC